MSEVLGMRNSSLKAPSLRVQLYSKKLHVDCLLEGAKMIEESLSWVMLNEKETNR